MAAVTHLLSYILYNNITHNKLILISRLEKCAFAGVSPHEAFAYCMELVPACLFVMAPAN